MTQVDRIRGIIFRLGSSDLFSIDDIQSDTKFPRTSIRRILSTLSRSGEITRVEPGLFKSREDISREIQWHRKFIATQKYQSSPRQFFAVTYEQNDIDRESELLKELDFFLNNTGYVEGAGTTGYSDEEIEDMGVDLNFVFPDIQVGAL